MRQGLVIDLSRLRGITVDPGARTVRVQARCTWGEMNDALQPHGLAATGGFVSVTGVSGLTLGGGLGWLVRKHGLALDNLLSAEVVLADGRLVAASARENDDLFRLLEIELPDGAQRRGHRRHRRFLHAGPSPQTVIVLEHNGDSAWDRVPDSATAFGYRAWPYNFVVTSARSDAKDSQRNISWTRALFDAMRPFAAKGAYVNYLGGDEGVDGLEAAYGPKLARLAAVKAKFDPTNLFRMNQNIAPSSVA
jgi:FAD/FMN-containing dehydrogenase